MKPWIRTFAVILLLGSLGMTSAVGAVELRAWFDRDTVQAGETVTLNVEASGRFSGQPDFTPLDRDFEQLGTSSSSAINVVNGATSTKQLWAVALAPKHEGRIEIAPIRMDGASAAPLVLTVLPAPAGASGHAGDEAFVEFALEPIAPYVQQQITATVKLYYAVALTDGRLDDPHADGLVVKKLGQDKPYQADRDGRRYQVVERHYALSAEHSGDLAIPALEFRGHAVAAAGPGGLFPTRGRPLGARSDAFVLHVRPRPETAGTGPWLPAQALDYRAEGLTAGTQAKVGEPLTLTLRLDATGLGFEQLPELALPPLDGAEVYPDKADTATRDDGTWLIGTRQRKFAIVPTRPGTLHIPALRLAWWDTVHDRAAEAVIPAVDLAVAPAAAATPPAASGTPAERLASPAPADVATATTTAAASPEPWRTLALASLGLWLASAAFLAVRTARRHRSKSPVAHAARDEPPRAREAKAAFLAACRANDAAAATAALLRWAEAEGRPCLSLGELAARLTAPEQQAAIAGLQRQRFAGEESPAGLERLSAAFANGFSRERSEAPAADESPLPALYAGRQPTRGTRHAG